MRSKNIFLLAIMAVIMVGCSSPEKKNNISTTEEWVSFCKNKPDAESIYNTYMSMSLSDCIAIFGELETVLENDNNCTKEKCYAFSYMLHLLSFDWDSHPEKFDDKERDRLNEVFHRHYFFAALYNASTQTGDTQTGDISTEIQTLARLFGSKMLQESTINSDDDINTLTSSLSPEEVLGILTGSDNQTTDPYFEDIEEDPQPGEGYEEIGDEPTDEDVILPYSTDEIAPEY